MQHPVSAPIGATVPNYADRIGFAQLTRQAFEGVDLQPLRDQLVGADHGGNGAGGRRP